MDFSGCIISERMRILTLSEGETTGGRIMAIIGIDLGTTNSLACVCQDGKAVLIPNSLGENLTPSVVSIDENGEICVARWQRNG